MWLEYFQYDFKKLVQWLNVKNIFVDENYDVFDLEKDDGTVISEYKDGCYSRNWSDDYYANIKAKILVYKIVR